MFTASKRELQLGGVGVASLLARVFGKLSRIWLSIAAKIAPPRAQESLVIGSTRYDMVDVPGEAYFAAQYWSAIEPTLAHLPPGAGLLGPRL
jgi:hypothetical protein